MDNSGAILIVDDDEDFSCLLELALREVRVENPIEVMNDACSALDYLERLSHPGAQSVPALVLLDLRMPKLCGLEVLRRIRYEPRINQVPIVVLTGLESGEEPATALQLGAASVMLKPFAYRELVKAAHALREQYLERWQLAHAA